MTSLFVVSVWQRRKEKDRRHNSLLKRKREKKSIGREGERCSVCTIPLKVFFLFFTYIKKKDVCFTLPAT